MLITFLRPWFCKDQQSSSRIASTCVQAPSLEIKLRPHSFFSLLGTGIFPESVDYRSNWYFASSLSLRVDQVFFLLLNLSDSQTFLITQSKLVPSKLISIHYLNIPLATNERAKMVSDHLNQRSLGRGLFEVRKISPFDASLFSDSPMFEYLNRLHTVGGVPFPVHDFLRYHFTCRASKDTTQDAYIKNLKSWQHGD